MSRNNRTSRRRYRVWPTSPARNLVEEVSQVAHGELLSTRPAGPDELEEPIQVFAGRTRYHA